MREKGWKYNKAKIYYIKSMHYDKIYIGATTSYSLMNVLCKCINRYKKYKLGESRYELVFKLIELGMPHIYEIEKYPCLNKMQLNLRIDKHKEDNADKLYIPSKHDTIIDNLVINKDMNISLELYLKDLVLKHKNEASIKRKKDLSIFLQKNRRTEEQKKKNIPNKITLSKGDFTLVFD